VEVAAVPVGPVHHRGDGQTPGWRAGGVVHPHSVKAARCPLGWVAKPVAGEPDPFAGPIGDRGCENQDQAGASYANW